MLAAAGRRPRCCDKIASRKIEEYLLVLAAAQSHHLRSRGTTSGSTLAAPRGFPPTAPAASKRPWYVCSTRRQPGADPSHCDQAAKRREPQVLGEPGNLLGLGARSSIVPAYRSRRPRDEGICPYLRSRQRATLRSEGQPSAASRGAPAEPGPQRVRELRPHFPDRRRAGTESGPPPFVSLQISRSRGWPAQATR